MSQDEQFTVLVNIEDQYATVPVSWPVPEGWRSAGFEGTREECTRYVDGQWTDMRPASLRRAMDGDPHGVTP
ncbi:MbtH family protein [Kibdelosporangium aridum]|uniref:MbtH protein n=1 Tax=Kibdelosporangium aridum TaxID=2030 RepID=A0A1W2FYJ6_KIBAR|nr:MbtH family NRPS accessory protein [Kibdelosporangium aridum]SMD26923.1 MbtH protein [Kibdelosporangium aridum]